MAVPGDKNHIIKLIKSHHINSKKIQEIIDFAIEKKGIEYSVAKMNEFKDEALSLISNYPDNDAKKSLINLLNMLLPETSNVSIILIFV